MTKIDLSRPEKPNDPRFMGVEYRIPWGCVRRFDSGHIAWFVHSSRNGKKRNGPYHVYCLHFDPENTYSGKYQLKLEFYWDGHRSYGFFGCGKTMREAFQTLREDMTLSRRVFQTFKMKSGMRKD